MDDFAQHPQIPHEVVTWLASEEQTELRRQMAEKFRRRNRRLWRIALVLFVLTCASTWMTTGVHEDGSPNGPLYAGAVMAILLTHELGHFFQTLRYRVPATPPFFIPFPGTPFGTMGAVIAQAAGVADRKALFDIAISGPLAGLVIALPVAWWGLQTTQVATVEIGQGAVIFTDPLVLRWMIELKHGPLLPNQEVTLNPLLLAGWVGIFVTGLNLLPVGQLDGGHILYTLIGRRAHWVAVALVALAISHMAYSQDLSYLLFVLLILWMGPRHPPTSDDSRPLGWFRIVLGWLTLSFVLIGFTPQPLVIVQPAPASVPAQQPVEAD